MRHGHAIDAALRDLGGEESVTQTPPGIFQIPAPRASDAGHVLPAGKKWKSELGGQLRDELFVCFGICPSQTMIEVQHGETDSLPLAYHLQNPEQGYGI
jgi:hypothetical protein